MAGVGGRVVASRSAVDEDIAVMEEWLQSMAADCNLTMTDVTDEDFANALGNEEGGDLSEGRTRFAGLDQEILAILKASGGNHSTKNDTWSRRRFDEWRLQNGIPTSVAIETMDLQDLAAQLPTFFRQVKKHNGDFYPLESLLGFYRGFTRIMQKAQEARICETRVIETPFCMRSLPSFHQTGVAFLEAMRRSVLAGANKRRKNAAVVSWANEQAMLADKDHQAAHPYGCFRRWAYYCISRFVMRSGKELYNVMDCDFQERRDENGSCVVYGERLSVNSEDSTLTSAPVSPTPSKAARSATKRAKVEPLHVPVKCHQEDVIQTYRQFMKHQPVKVGEEVGKPRHLFLQPIGNPVTNAWFAKSHISERVLISIYKTMAAIAGVHVKDVSNNAGRPTIGGRGTAASGISSNGFCDRYVTHVDQRNDGVQRSINKVWVSNGGKRYLQEAYGDMIGKQDDTQQISSRTSSVKSMQLLGSSPDHACTSAVSGLTGIVPRMVLANCSKQHAENLDSTTQGQDVLTKLQIARHQFKDLELALFSNVALPGVRTSTTGQSLRDVLHVAMAHLKGLEATLASMISIS